MRRTVFLSALPCLPNFLIENFVCHIFFVKSGPAKSIYIKKKNRQLLSRRWSATWGQNFARSRRREWLTWPPSVWLMIERVWDVRRMSSGSGGCWLINLSRFGATRQQWPEYSGYPKWVRDMNIAVCLHNNVAPTSSFHVSASCCSSCWCSDQTFHNFRATW